ncbi:MAG: ACT domain-containing protein, partial [Chromatiales bacterium]|nr:ACT domain-containing protein [Chromatiales bacterium]
WLGEYLPDVERVAVSSNAEGARRARDEQGTAAIAGGTAADVYDLKILVSNIEDRPDNTTRFLVIGRDLLASSGDDKTSVLISAADTDSPGALYRLLEPLARHGISMTRIESRPSQRKKWHYVFFMDLDGHASDPALSQALAELEEQASLFRILGSYPKAVM